MSERISYRADIDGLRAIAVLAVVFFHFEISGFPGGYVGVDVFFVISGYLITSIIYKDLKSGTFSFREFYKRRVKRIAPALLATLALTTVLVFKTFSPFLIENYVISAFRALTMSSNYFFLGQAGYFDNLAVTKPLLHTWSLSIEEQFYIVWPAFLVGLFAFFKGRHLVLCTVIVLLISLAGNILVLRADQAAAFYSTPLRFYELLIGAGLALRSPTIRNRCAAELITITGLGLIIVSVVCFTDDTLFPGTMALIPCIGTALLIMAGQGVRTQQPVTSKVLGSTLLVYIGKISYSLYLIHWPVFVCYTISKPYDIPLLEKVILICVSTVLAAFMYHFIEQPFRQKKSDIISYRLSESISLKIVLGVYLCSVFFSFYLTQFTSLQARFFAPGKKDVTVNIDTNAYNLEALRFAKVKFVAGHKYKSLIGSDQSILVIGDSHAAQITAGLLLNKKEQTEVSLGTVFSACQKLYPYVLSDREIPSTYEDLNETKVSQCVEAISMAFAPENLEKARIIIVTHKWSDEFLQSFDHIVQKIREHSNAKIIFFGQTVILNMPLAQILTSEKYFDGKFVSGEVISPEVRRINDAFENEISQQENIAFINTSQLAYENGKYRIILDNSDLAFYDYNHWTLKGAAHFIGKLNQHPLLEEMIKAPRKDGAVQ